ncbi:reverse transcriptase domain-containing protein [Tanacetum coccineum]
MEKFETPPDSPPITVIDLDDQPMWSSIRTVALTPSSTIVQIPIPNNFHIKGTHIQMIRDNQFNGRIRSDPHRNVADFLEISNLFQYGKNEEEAFMLKTFSFSLSGEAKTWLNELDEGTITSWNEMREAFISRYFSPAKFKRLLNEIHSFHQLAHETLVEAWLRMKEMLRTCYGHAFKILEDKVLLKLDFSDNSQNKPKPKTIVSAGGSNINPDYAILMEKFEALATKINSEFLIIRKELNEMRDGLRDDEGNPISDYYVKDDTPMYDPMEANYIQGHHSSYQNRNYPQSRPQCRMPHLSQYIELPKTLMEEMMREWMARQTKANERMKNQMVE